MHIPDILCPWIPKLNPCIVWKKVLFLFVATTQLSYDCFLVPHIVPYSIDLYHIRLFPTEAYQSISSCLMRELLFTPDQPQWPPLNHFSIYHIHLKVKAREQSAVFKTLALLNDIMMSSPFFSILSLTINILLLFDWAEFFSKLTTRTMRSLSSGVMVNLEWLHM